MRKFPAITRPGMGSRLAIPGSCSWGGVMKRAGPAGWYLAFGEPDRLPEDPSEDPAEDPSEDPEVAADSRFARERLIAQADAEIARGLDGVRIEGDGLHRGDRLLHRHRHHVRRIVRDDVPELSLFDHP